MGFSKDRFVQPPMEELICPSCMGVVDKPSFACPEQHTYCASCLRDMILEGRSCPCEMNLSLMDVKTNVFAARVLGSCEIFCPNRNNGCKEVLPVSFLESHTRRCTFSAVECPHKDSGCDWSGSDAEKHLAEGCEHEDIVCPLGGRHCGGIEGAGVYKRSGLVAHERFCGGYRCHVEGCPTFGTKASIEVHEPACLAVHQRCNQAEQAANYFARQIQKLRDDATTAASATLPAIRFEQAKSDVSSTFLNPETHISRALPLRPFQANPYNALHPLVIPAPKARAESVAAVIEESFEASQTEQDRRGPEPERQTTIDSNENEGEPHFDMLEFAANYKTSSRDDTLIRFKRQARRAGLTAPEIGQVTVVAIRNSKKGSTMSFMEIVEQEIAKRPKGFTPEGFSS